MGKPSYRHCRQNRWLLTFLICMGAGTIYGQKTDSFLCSALNQIIASPVFDKQFSFTAHLDEVFTIVDTCHAFSSCSLDTVKGRPVNLNHSGIPKTTMIEKSSLVIASKTRKGKRLTFSFWCPAHGSTLAVHYERSRKSWRLLGYKMGDM